MQDQPNTEHSACSHCTHHNNVEWILEMETWSQLEAFRQSLCQRPAFPKVPAENLEDIEAVITYRNSHNLLTSTKSIPPSITLKNQAANSTPLRISCWKGDITTLTNVTAIVNAANAQLEGCFRPAHRCIDNVIHSAAGPRLREACNAMISSQGHLEPIGSAKVTPGFLLPAQWVLHTVGPQLHPGAAPLPKHKNQLASCYRSCLDAAELLPPLSDDRKVIAFCCISTGIFAFPSDLAASIAVEAVLSWYEKHPFTSITDIIFDTFLEKDRSLYTQILSDIQTSGREATTLEKPAPVDLQHANSTITSIQGITKARKWLEDATHIIISAGAGLSAATGLDYTSTTLFEEHFPALKSKGLHRLYDVFGYDGWDSLGQKWGYYILHLNLVRNWPTSALYKTLYNIIARFPQENLFIRTTNADGFFVKNGFNASRISTPQGRYQLLQCYDKCRSDAVFDSDDFVDAALPFIDPVSQVITDETKIPRCRFCGGELFLCVRGGSFFNDMPFRAQEFKYKKFLEKLAHESERHDTMVNPVIMELGVGLNTPGVLRWPNEDLVSEKGHGGLKLIRIGMDASGCIPWNLEDEGLAIGISGDIKMAVDLLTTQGLQNKTN